MTALTRNRTRAARSTLGHSPGPRSRPRSLEAQLITHAARSVDAHPAARARPALVARLRWRGLRLLSLAALFVAALTTSAQAATVGLGTADRFSVLGGQSVSNTGPSVIVGDLGVSPGTAVTGFPPGTVTGPIHGTDALAQQAQADLTTAYNDAAGRSSTATVSADLAGRTLGPGVYTSASSLGLSGDLTLDAHGDANAVFVFQAGSSLTTASGSRVQLIGGAQACNVFWQVGSSATIGTATAFTGNILALTSISLTTRATIVGRALARNGAVTMDTNTVTRAACSTVSGSTRTQGTPTTGASPPATARRVPRSKSPARPPRARRHRPRTPRSHGRPPRVRPARPITPGSPARPPHTPGSFTG